MSTPYTGQQLREMREAQDLKVFELAARMGVHSSRVSQIEALALVTPITARRYLAALQSSPVAKTGESTAGVV
jgi:transcriptional regulator with XRE-family HTH domain